MAKNKKYTGEDITVLTMDIERVQMHPHLYIPDKSVAGFIHLCREIKDNACLGTLSSNR